MTANINKPNNRDKSSVSYRDPNAKQGLNSYCHSGKTVLGFTIGDKLVLLFAVCMLVGLYTQLWGSGVRANQVEVLLDGKHWSTFDLFNDHMVDVPGLLGVSKLIISAGQVRFVESPCDGKQCIHHGWLSHGGEFAACLPNGISVRILGADPRFDTINF